MGPLETEAAFELAQSPMVPVFVPVPASVAAEQVRAFRSYNSMLPLAVPLPEVPFLFDELEQFEYEELGIRLGDIENANNLLDEFKRKARPIKIKAGKTVLVRQRFLLEHPAIVRKHEHFGQAKELRSTAHLVIIPERFDPDQYNATNRDELVAPDWVFRGRHWITAENPEGLTAFYLFGGSCSLPPTRASIMVAVGARRDLDPVWRRMTASFEQEPARTDIEYCDANGTRRSVSAKVAALEHVNQRDPNRWRLSTYCNPHGLGVTNWAGLRLPSSLTSITVETETGRVVSTSEAPVITTAAVM